MESSERPISSPETPYQRLLQECKQLIADLGKYGVSKTLQDLLGRKRTKPLFRADEAFIVPSSLEVEGLNVSSFKRGLATGEIIEIGLDNDKDAFLRVLEIVDRNLFPSFDKGDGLVQGWRTFDVHVGSYIPPAAFSIFGLMEAFSEKVSSMWLDLRSEDYPRFFAWITWMLINIHPKRDGNGRYSQAVAEYLSHLFGEGQNILGWQSELWTSVFLITDPEMLKAVAVKNGQRIPDTPQIDVSETAVRRRMDFYRFQEHDWTAKILKEAIDQTTLDDQGGLHLAGLSTKALNLMEQFLAQAPKAQTFFSLTRKP